MGTLFTQHPPTTCVFTLHYRHWQLALPLSVWLCVKCVLGFVIWVYMYNIQCSCNLMYLLEFLSWLRLFVEYVIII